MRGIGPARRHPDEHHLLDWQRRRDVERWGGRSEVGTGEADFTVLKPSSAVVSVADAGVAHGRSLASALITRRARRLISFGDISERSPSVAFRDQRNSRYRWWSCSSG